MGRSVITLGRRVVKKLRRTRMPFSPASPSKGKGRGEVVGPARQACRGGRFRQEIGSSSIPTTRQQPRNRRTAPDPDVLSGFRSRQGTVAVAVPVRGASGLASSD